MSQQAGTREHSSAERGRELRARRGGALALEMWTYSRREWDSAKAEKDNGVGGGK